MNPSKTAARKAGNKLILYNEGPEYLDALDILFQWRAMHVIPMRSFRALCSRNADNNMLIAQRLKRTPSIIDKLKRNKNITLNGMQDIAGLRVIVDSCNKVYDFYNTLLANESDIYQRPILSPHDYIKTPKPDGYRSLHQVFKYTSKQHPELNGLKIELQIRTEIQHLWATGVEVIDIIKNSSIKTGKGSEDYKIFFRLASALFSIYENKPILEEYKNFSEKEIVNLFIKQEQKLKVFDTLLGVTTSIKHIDSIPILTNEYHVLILDCKNKRVSINPIPETEIDFSESAYNVYEKFYQKDSDKFIVLISAGDIKGIRKAYPNYFLDTNKFVETLDNIVNTIK